MYEVIQIKQHNYKVLFRSSQAAFIVQKKAHGGDEGFSLRPPGDWPHSAASHK
jgi:hypothetical protein